MIIDGKEPYSITLCNEQEFAVKNHVQNQEFVFTNKYTFPVLATQLNIHCTNF